MLWENYLISERLKVLANHGKYPRQYFWRTTTQQEVDYLEEGNEKLSAWEFKWNLKAKHKIPNAFISAYPEAQTEFISPDNYDEFLLM